MFSERNGRIDFGGGAYSKTLDGGGVARVGIDGQIRTWQGYLVRTIGLAEISRVGSILRAPITTENTGFVKTRPAGQSPQLMSEAMRTPIGQTDRVREEEIAYAAQQELIVVANK